LLIYVFAHKVRLVDQRNCRVGDRTMERTDNLDQEWYNVRKRMLSMLMVVFIIAAAPIVLLNDYKMLDPVTPVQKTLIYGVSNLGYLYLIGIFLLRKRIPLKIQYLLMIISNMIFGILGEFVFGNSGLTVFFFIIAALLTEFYFDDKWKFLILGISIVSILSIGYLFVVGLIPPTPNLDIKEGTYRILFLRALNYIFFASVMLYFVNRSKHYLFHTIEDLKNKYAALSKVHVELALKDEELRRKYSDLEEKEKKIYHLAYYDSLTGLPNKILLEERVAQEIEKMIDSRSKFALAYIDLDNLKKVNISKGHQTGDSLIVQTINSIRDFLGPDPIIARIGGDEFAVLLKETDGSDSIDTKIEKLIDTIAIPHIIQESSYQLGSCIGVALYPNDGTTYDELLKNANTAMYKSKPMGKNSYQFYSSDMKKEADDRLELEICLNNALENKEIEANYQPIVNAKTGKIEKIETLMRWKSARFGNVSPAKFIPILEETKKIVEFGDFIMLKACELNKKLKNDFGANVITAVNISTTQLMQPDFVKKVAKTISDSGISAGNLELEITESLMIADFDFVRDILYQLKRIGVKISLDDFGTGYSSLNYIRNLSIDTLKIDKTFVDDLLKADNTPIIGSIISLAHNLNLEVIAEGVETKEQSELLEYNNCDLLQGFYFYKPLSETDVYFELKKESLV